MSWVKEKFSKEYAVENCARRCNGLASMFRLTRCPEGFCRCICEFSASADGTCVIQTEESLKNHQIYKFIPTGFVKQCFMMSDINAIKFSSFLNDHFESFPNLF